jgi:hypothetical protein
LQAYQTSAKKVDWFFHNIPLWFDYFKQNNTLKVLENELKNQKNLDYFVGFDIGTTSSKVA